MRFALTGEGATDYGRVEYGQDILGPAYYYIKGILDKYEEEPECKLVSRKEIKDFKLQRSQKKTDGSSLEGKSIPAKKFRIVANMKGFDKGIYFCDADRDAGAKNTKHEAEARYRKIYDEVRQGLEDKGFIPMIPMRMIECWMLGSRSALSAVYGVSKKDVPGNPEYLWGDKRDSKSNYPKNVLDELVSNAKKSKDKMSTVDAESMCEVAVQSEIEELLESCPLSYGTFHRDACEWGKMANEELSDRTV